MSLTYAQREDAILEVMLPGLEEEGYVVFRQPAAAMLPAFLRDCRPDAIAVKGGKKIAVEVAPSTRPDGPARLARLRGLLAEHPDWELRVFYAPSSHGAQPIAVVSRTEIEKNLSRLENVRDAAGMVAGLLLAWSIFEAAARALSPDDLSGPQSPARLVERLAFDGHVTPDEADTLRHLGFLRNQAAHGRLDVPFEREDLTALARIIRILLDARDEMERSA